MTTKFLTSNHPDAYGLKSNYSELVIDLGVSVGTVDSKYGVASSHTATIVNYGTVGSVGSYYGVYLREGGRVTNGSATDTKAVISGGYTQGAAVDAKGASATLTNFGTILGTENNNSLGVNLYDGGTVSNGSAADTTALISAALGIYSRASVVTTVVNFGTIYGGGGAAVDFQDAADRLVVESKAAFMGGVSGGGGTLELAAGSDTITGLGAQGVMTGSTAASFDEFGAYIVDAGARLTLTGTNALTTGKSLSVAGSLINTGSLQAASRYDNGVDLSPGGRVTNGSATDSTASISGYFGVSATGSAGSAGVTVTNFGTIFGTSRYSVDFVSASDRLIVEAGSVLVGEVLGDGGTLELAGGSETITGLGSYGAMTGGASGDLYGFGAYLVDAGAQLTLTGTNALATGQSLSVAGALVNTGTLRGPSASGYGVTLTGGRLTNGSATDAAALTIGYIGVYAAGSAPATVTNFGTIEGTGGVALDFHAAGDRLIVEETAAFVGALAGGGGTLELVGGSDTITGLGGAGKLTGSVLASFSGFATYVVDTGAQLTLTGNNLLTTHQSAVSVAGSLVNTGTLSAPAGGYGLTLTGGRLTNGSAADTTALILSTYGNGGADYAVRTSGAGSTISNFGTIRGQAGVYMDGGTLTNGSVADTAALISSTLDQGVGDFGVRTYGTGVATITNFGTIHGEMGVYIDGGTLTNGSAADTTALISSTLEYGVATYGTVATTITNFGTISSASAPAVRLGLAADRLIVESKAVFVGALEGGGGTLELAGGSDTISGLGGAGVITGSTSTSFSGFGAYVVDAGADLTLTGTNALATGQSLESAGALVNTGTLAGPAASGYGVTLLGGSLTNGSAADTTALITGDRSGVYAVVGTTVTVTNFGMIQALGAGNTVGVNLWANGKVANGSAADTIALIKGGIGVYSYGPAVTTVTNFGTIDGTGGTAVDFHDGADRLVVESKAVFVGALVGGGGTLELAGGSDTITGLGGSGTMTGATSASFSGFATYQLNVGVSCTLTGANALSSTQKVIDSGAVVVSGTLSGAGIVGGTGTASVTAAGTIDASAATALTLDPKSVANGGLLEGTGAGGLTLSATTVANTGVIEAAMGSRVTLRGADIRGGTLLTAGTGKIDTSSGVNVLDGTASSVTNSGTIDVLNGTGLTIEGVIVGAGRIALSASTAKATLTVGAAGVTLTGGGTVVLGNNAGNAITGASATAVLTNAGDTLQGAGALGGGQMTLINDKGARILGVGTVGLTLDTGANAITNGGLIEADKGAVTIKSAVNNTGTLLAYGATLTLAGAVTGIGTGRIQGGTLDAQASFTEAVTFVGGTGTLELAHSQSYTGRVTGFSLTGGTALDLDDITYTKGVTTATFVENGIKTAGVLTVTDGTHTAKITLAGNFSSSTFTTSSDGHGGTKVVDPPASASAALFASQAAAMGASAGAASLAAQTQTMPPAPLLAASG